MGWFSKPTELRAAKPLSLSWRPTGHPTTRWLIDIDSMCIPLECIFSGWWLTYRSEKYDFVSWDDDIPNMMGKITNVPNHQPVYKLRISYD